MTTDSRPPNGGTLDCLTCGACCRGAHHIVNIAIDEPIVTKRPDLVELKNGAAVMQIAPCAALEVTREGGGAAYRCSVYEDRPRTCRNYERGGRLCLSARERMGVS